MMPPNRRKVCILGSTEKQGEHFLQSGDFGLSRALGEVLKRVGNVRNMGPELALAL
jgi:hypothetical protein